MEMARERFSFVSDETKEQMDLESRIRAGEITAENFSELSQEDQTEVNAILFKMASEKIEPNQGSSTLEFVLFGFMRVAMKRMHGMSLTEDEKEIEESLKRIMSLHQITDTTLFKSEWLFDYMEYAEMKAAEILRNRKEHIDRKQQVTGKA